MVLKPDWERTQAQSPTASGLSQRSRCRRWVTVGLCAAPLIGSFFYRYGYRLPLWGCPLRSLTGIPCPTCGMTRSFVAIAQGNLGQAFHYHLFGPAVFLAFLVILLHLLWELKTNKACSNFYSAWMTKPSVYVGALIPYGGYYLTRLIHLGNTGELLPAFWASPAGVWISQGHL